MKLAEVYTILHTESSKQWGQHEKRTLEELRALHLQGHHIFLCASSDSQILKKAKEMGYVHCIAVEFTFTKLIKALRSLLKLLRKQRIDISVTHSSKDAWICGIAARLAKIFGKAPRIVRKRVHQIAKKRPLNHFVLYNLLCDTAICTHREIADQLQKEARLNPKRVLAIPSGLDTKHLERNLEEENQWRKALEAKPEDLLIGTVDIGDADCKQFLEIASVLIKKEALEKPLWPFMRFVVICGETRRAHLKKMRKRFCEDLAKEIRECAIADSLPDLSALEIAYSFKALEQRVVFINPEKRTPSFLGALDLFCLLSPQDERAANVALQAALQETALVSSPCSFLENPCPAAHLPYPFSKWKAAQIISEIVKNPDSRKQMAQAQKKQLMQSQDQEKSLEKTLSVYSSLLS